MLIVAQYELPTCLFWGTALGSFPYAYKSHHPPIWSRVTQPSHVSWHLPVYLRRGLWVKAETWSSCCLITVPSLPEDRHSIWCPQEHSRHPWLACLLTKVLQVLVGWTVSPMTNWFKWMKPLTHLVQLKDGCGVRASSPPACRFFWNLHINVLKVSYRK